MRLQQLRYFVAVAEQGSFTQAADALYVAQPSVSQQIQRLEVELGVQLLDRSQRVIVPTEIGARLLKRVRAVLAEVSDIERESADYSGLGFGTLRIGTVPSASRMILPRALPWFTGKYPGIELEVQEAGSLEVVDLVREGQLDLGLVIQSPVEPDVLAGFDLAPLQSGVIAACLPVTNPLSRRFRIRLDELRDEPIIQFRRGYLVQQVVAAAASWDIAENVVYATDNTESARSMVAAGVGITFVSYFPGTTQPGNSEVRLVTLAPPKLPVRLTAITYADRYTPQAAAVFLDGIRSMSDASRGASPRRAHGSVSSPGE